MDIIGLALLLAAVDMRAAENDPDRAPAQQVTRPRDLLKEADGLELR